MKKLNTFIEHVCPAGINPSYREYREVAVEVDAAIGIPRGSTRKRCFGFTGYFVTRKSKPTLSRTSRDTDGGMLRMPEWGLNDFTIFSL